MPLKSLWKEDSGAAAESCKDDGMSVLKLRGRILRGFMAMFLYCNAFSKKKIGIFIAFYDHTSESSRAVRIEQV